MVTIGISLTIPLALVGSLIRPTATPAAITTLSLGGAAMVVVAFALLGWQEWIVSQGDGKDMQSLPDEEAEPVRTAGLGLWDERDQGSR